MAEADGGTKLTMEFEPRPKGLLSILFPLMRPMMKREMAKQHANFKTLCETGS